MIIQDSTITIKFARVENLKRLYFKNEDALREAFNEATVLPIPDDAPSEIPRIILKSKNEYTQLNISSDTISMQTVYDESYRKNWTLCEKYINDKIKYLFDFADSLTNGNYNYVGIVISIIEDEINKNATEILTSNLLSKKSQTSPYDLNIKYTFLEENAYFVNIAIQNVRVFSGDTDASVSGALSDANLRAHTIGATVDVNDRYRFNNVNDYKSGKESLIKVLSLTTKSIEKLGPLIKEGVY